MLTMVVRYSLLAICTSVASAKSIGRSDSEPFLQVDQIKPRGTADASGRPDPAAIGAGPPRSCKARANGAARPFSALGFNCRAARQSIRETSCSAPISFSELWQTRMPAETYEQQVVSGPAGPARLLSAAQCNACHDATPQSPLSALPRGHGAAPVANRYRRQKIRLPRLQPHYQIITSGNQVQIYQELIRDSNDTVTT